LVFKLGKYGKFLSCSGYPDCEYAKPLEEDIALGPDGQPEDFGTCEECKEER
jgi:DNA topoisomerase-1